MEEYCWTITGWRHGHAAADQVTVCWSLGSSCTSPCTNAKYIYIYIYIYVYTTQLVSLEFFIGIKSFQSHYGPGVDSASNRNEYQEYFLEEQEAGA